VKPFLLTSDLKLSSVNPTLPQIRTSGSGLSGGDPLGSSTHPALPQSAQTRLERGLTPTAGAQQPPQSATLLPPGSTARFEPPSPSADADHPPTQPPSHLSRAPSSGQQACAHRRLRSTIARTVRAPRDIRAVCCGTRWRWSRASRRRRSRRNRRSRSTGRRRVRCCSASSPPTTGGTTAWTSSPAATCPPASCRSTPGTMFLTLALLRKRIPGKQWIGKYRRPRVVTTTMKQAMIRRLEIEAENEYWLSRPYLTRQEECNHNREARVARWEAFKALKSSKFPEHRYMSDHLNHLNVSKKWTS
uniref:Mitochondrial ribosomal protein L57 n=1 Tax=Gallus gallus TaxID=9031 RepID=A0A8V0XHF0_CHICK